MLPYAPSLRSYLELVVNEPHRRLPDNMSLAEWFRENEFLLHKNPYLREKNDLVATQFLPLFEQNPNWEALGFLNCDSPDQQTDFQAHLLVWYRQTPQPHQVLVRRVLQMFEWNSPEAVVSDRAEASP